MIDSVIVKNLTGLQKPSPSPSLTPSGVTVIARPWAKTHHQTPMTCTYTIDKSIGTPPSLEQKNALQICGNDGNIIHVFKNCISISVATVLEVSKMTVPICTSHWCLVMSFWLKVCIYSHTRGVKLGLGLGFMQTSQVLPHWLNQSFLFEPCLIKSNQIKSNHFYCHIITAHVPWWVKFLRACSRQCRNN